MASEADLAAVARVLAAGIDALPDIERGLAKRPRDYNDLLRRLQAESLEAGVGARTIAMRACHAEHALSAETTNGNGFTLHRAQRAWATVLAGWRRDRAVALGALHALHMVGADARGEHLLCQELERVLPVALAEVTDRESMAAFVERLGAPKSGLKEAGADVAATIRSEAGKGSEAWDPVRIATAIGVALWNGLVVRRVPRSIATVPLSVAESVAEVFGKGTFVEVAGDRVVLLSRSRAPIADTPLVDGAAFEDLQRASGILQRYLAVKLLRYIPAELWRRFIARDPRWMILHYRGLEGLAEQLGEANPRNLKCELLDLLRAGAAFRRKWADGFEIGGAWTYQLTRLPLDSVNGA